MADFDKKVALIEIDIDQTAAKKQVDQLTDSIIEQKKAIKDNTDEIKKLNKGTEEEQEQAKKLEKENLKLRDGLNDLNAERRQAVKATKLQSNSLDALRKTVAAQKKELNGLNTATEQGRKRFDELSKELKQNNELIKDLDKSAGDFKTNIGDYPDILDDMGGGLGGAIQGMKGLTAASMKFIATPIGLVLGAVAAAVALVQNAMNRSEASTNRLRRAFAPLEGVMNLALGALEPLGEFLIDGIVRGFELAAQSVTTFLDLLAKSYDFIGLDQVGDAVRQLNEDITEAGESSVKLADDTAKLTQALREQEIVQLRFQRLAEEQRQIRDDESRSIQERIEANRELGRVLQRQSQEELKIANLALSVVEQRIKMEGESSELLDARFEALLKIEEINERITSQESEQLTNINSLRREQRDLLNEIASLQREQQEEQEEFFKVQQAEINEEAERQLLEHTMRKVEIVDDGNKKILKSDKDTEAQRRSVIQKSTDFIEKLFTTSNKDIGASYDERLEKIQTNLENGVITEEQAAKQTQKIEKERASALYAAEKAEFRAKKLFNIGRIISDTARAVTSVLPNIPLSLTIGGLGAAQLVKATATQPPPPPRFAEGGTVISGRSHATGGEDIWVGGRRVGNMQGGEGLFVTKREATKNALSFFNEKAGGKSFFGTSSRYLQEGGRVDTSTEARMTRAEIMQIMESLPPFAVQAESFMGAVEAEEQANNLGVI